MLISDAYKDIANVTLWLKLQSRDQLLLSDIPTIIPLRWPYFRDNWEFIKADMMERINQYPNPDFLSRQIKDFSTYIDSQRNVASKINPFSGTLIFYQFYAVFDNISINSIRTTNEEDDIISSTIRTIELFTKNNFIKARDNIIKARDNMADIVGQSDADYNKIFNRSSVPKQVNITINYVNQMQQLENVIGSIDFILANLYVTDDSFIDPFALARQNAHNPEVKIGQYLSGVFVKLQYGEDLQSLAYRYLGDRDRWIDIAIANGLKPPYIDEVGERISLIANGANNQINLAGLALDGSFNKDKISINGIVFLQSDTQRFPEQRIIVNIIEVPVSGDLVIELNGENNLNRYKINENANIRVFKPNSINSNFFILIPSSQPLPDGRRDDTPWFLFGKGESEKRVKVDISLDSDGDLILTSNGDIQLSYGLANAIQAIKLKLIIELGELRYHPNFGLKTIQGMRNTDIDRVKDTLMQSITSQIQIDSRFDRVESLDISYTNGAPDGNGASAFIVQLSVRLAGSNQVVPISFAVNVAQ